MPSALNSENPLEACVLYMLADYGKTSTVQPFVKRKIPGLAHLWLHWSGAKIH